MFPTSALVAFIYVYLMHILPFFCQIVCSYCTWILFGMTLVFQQLFFVCAETWNS